MRQYRILYRRPETDWTQLEPHIHSRVYDRPEINASIEHMRANYHVEGMEPKSFPMEAADATT
jgi:hypothetical protein